MPSAKGVPSIHLREHTHIAFTWPLATRRPYPHEDLPFRHGVETLYLHTMGCQLLRLGSGQPSRGPLVRTPA